MNLVKVTTRDKSSLFSEPKTKEFEYDPDEYTCSPEAMEYVTMFMAMGYSVTVDVYTEERSRGDSFMNGIVARVAGYA